MGVRGQSRGEWDPAHVPHPREEESARTARERAAHATHRAEWYERLRAADDADAARSRDVHGHARASRCRRSHWPLLRAHARADDEHSAACKAARPLMRCPIQREFLRLINMSPAEMRRWTKDTKSRCYNYTEDAPRTRKIADLKAKNRKRWTSEDCALASAAVAYVKRMKSAASGKQ